MSVFGEMDQLRDDSSALSENDGPTIIINISFRRKEFEVPFPEVSTIADMFADFELMFDIPKENLKVVVPKEPLLKYDNSTRMEEPLTNLVGKPLMLMGSEATTVMAMQQMEAKVAKRNDLIKALRANHTAKNTYPSTSNRSEFTFLQVEPLKNLPHSEKSRDLLLKLKKDPGIVTVMRKYEFTVGLLTEMEPLSNTEITHEGVTRLLGLNRNKGEVIELRLRTDAHDGYRHYNTIRDTLCHELAHNVHANHSPEFWQLCNAIQREVRQVNDKSRRLGHGLSEDSQGEAPPFQGDLVTDTGGWTGWHFRLGGIRHDAAGLNRREILANAAQKRIDKMKEAQKDPGPVKKVEKPEEDRTS